MFVVLLVVFVFTLGISFNEPRTSENPGGVSSKSSGQTVMETVNDYPDKPPPDTLPDLDYPDKPPPDTLPDRGLI